MKPLLPLLSSLIVLASCSTAYKSGQTPDDVYFSPVRPQEEYVQIEKDEDEDRSYQRRDADIRRQEDDYYTYNDDRYLRMKIRDRDRWSYLDDYYRDPYAYNYNSKYYYNQYGYSNPRSYWNSYYNPYGGQVVVVNRVNQTVNRPRTYNLHVFDTPPADNTNTGSKTKSSNRVNTRTDNSDRNNNNSSRNNGSELRTVFGSSNNNNNNNNSSSKPSTTVTPPASTNSNSSGSSEGSTAPRRKF